ncbi:MAG: UDP-N-acetylmuramoyl-tripeptide--D-alanyl-D-alanine ligase [Patescibacteria group bacterium]
MNIVIFIIVLFWVFRIVWNILSYAHLWFVKEYRIDRMRIHLRTDQGKRVLFPSFRRPPVSPKSFVLVFVTILSFGIFLYAEYFTILFSLLIFDLLLFPFMGVIVMMLQFPTYVYHTLLISQAIMKLRAHKKMLCFGVTGSYGKTSTKEYLGTILSESYEVLKTEVSKNSPIGIAELVLHFLTPTHSAFVVEMGAYKEGEISEMSRMVLPEIGIITAINEQHQDLFGSIDATMKAKYELIKNLTGRKIAIMNADNPYVVTMSEWAKKDGVGVWYYTTNIPKKLVSDHIFYIKNIVEIADGIRFSISYLKKLYEVSAPVIGKFQVSNITAAVAAAVAGGMEIQNAVSACKNLQSVPRMMQQLKGIHGSIYINDTFNNNPDAACAAIEYMRTCTKKKILVFQPMIELGSFSESAHARVGKLAGEVCDEIFLTNTNFRTPFTKGVESSSSHAHVAVVSPDESQKFLRKYLSEGDTVLFKGKEAQAVLTLLGEKTV